MVFDMVGQALRRCQHARIGGAVWQGFRNVVKAVEARDLFDQVLLDGNIRTVARHLHRQAVGVFLEDLKAEIEEIAAHLCKWNVGAENVVGLLILHADDDWLVLRWVFVDLALHQRRAGSLHHEICCAPASQRRRRDVEALFVALSCFCAQIQRHLCAADVVGIEAGGFDHDPQWWYLRSRCFRRP